MTKRWRPPRWAKPMERKKAEACEELIQQLNKKIGLSRRTAERQGIKISDLRRSYGICY